MALLMLAASVSFELITLQLFYLQNTCEVTSYLSRNQEVTFLLNSKSKVLLVACYHFHPCNFMSWQDVMTHGCYSCQFGIRAEQLHKCPINLSHNPVPKHFHHLVYSNTLI